MAAETHHADHGLTLEWAARMMRDAVKDRSYVDQTGIGREVDRYLNYFRGEYGAMPASVASYEYTLARLAVHYADLPLEAFEPPPGTDLVRDCWNHYWADCEPKTRVCRLAHFKSFFKWAVEERKLVGDPARAIRYPRGRGTERRAHPPSVVQAIIAAQDRPEDKIAVDLMGRHALRRNELRKVQARHFELDARLLTVFGKGGTVEPIPLFPDLAERVMRLALRRQWLPDEFLLYPSKQGMRAGRMETIWEDRGRPMGMSTVDKWWRRCLERAGHPHFPMHELRHSAGTNFYRQTRDLLLTQRLMRHASAKTTADVYLHLDKSDLAAVMATIESWD